MFKGYKLKFEFNAAHSNVENNIENVHFHTFTIVLYLNELNGQMDYFYEIEKNINEWLAPYQDCYLHETELFHDKSTTLESIGEVFYNEWHDKLKALQFDLVRLDIFENPIRMYSVSDRILDADVNEIGALPYAFYHNVVFEDGSESEPEILSPAENEPEPFEEAVKEESAETEKAAVVPETVKDRKGFRWLWVFGCFWVIIAFGFLVMYVLKNYGNYPAGSDTYCHLYRADLILNQMKNGNWFPLYDAYWYNGVEIMRYWGPVPLYVLAFTEWVGGSIFAGYIGYIGFLFVLGALGWLICGYKQDRIAIGLFVGVIWFFLPENMKVIFYDGNLPRALINALLPYFICFILDLLKEKKPGCILKLTLIFTVISLCHIGTTIMLLAVLIIYLLIYGKINKDFAAVGRVLVCTVIGILLSGVWLAASLHGSGAGGSGSNQIMEGFFQSAFLSLNPLPAWNGQTLFYFGLSLFLLCLCGTLFGNKNTLPGFAVGLIIFFLTTNSAYDILSKLPFSSYLWMMRFVSMALSFVMAAFLLWKGLKKPVVVLLCLLIAADCIPTVRYLYSGAADSTSVEEENKMYADSLLLNQAKEITGQRMSVFDLSGYGAFAPYYVAGVDRKVKYMFGAGWEGARTAENIVMLNTAVETGRYEYVFDRSIEFGTDTLVFVIDCLQNRERDLERLAEAGQKYGYVQIAAGEETVLFHKDTPETFGVITEYPYLAIGDAAHEIALLYPAFEEGRSDNLSDYTYDELAVYDIIYLSDFTYDDRQQAEQLLTELADMGTRIYVDMNKIPVDPESNLQELFGVSVQSIMYQNSFPTILYQEEEYKTSGFPEGYQEWKANYLIGLQEVTGYGDINNKKLAFCGTNGNDNIVFLGYNFVFFTELTADESAIGLLDAILGVESGQSPARKIVPIDVVYQCDRIMISSTYDDVNTTLADIPDIFTSKTGYETVHHFIRVNKGTTIIEIHYPYFIQGIMITLMGLVLLIGFMVCSKYFGHGKKRQGRRKTI